MKKRYDLSITYGKNNPGCDTLQYHILWPVPQGDIDANGGGRINQNFGYSGYEKNQPPDATLEDTLAGEN